MIMPMMEARLKKCPLPQTEGCTCCADACMMWRWAEPVGSRSVIRHTENCPHNRISLSMIDIRNSGECIVCGAPVIEITLPNERKGYCGLGGPALE